MECLVAAGSRYISVQGVAANDPIREELLRHGTVDGRWSSAVEKSSAQIPPTRVKSRWARG